MTRRKKTDGQKISHHIYGYDRWEVADYLDRYIRRRMADAWAEGHEWGVNDSPRPCCRFHLCTNPYRGRKKK